MDEKYFPGAIEKKWQKRWEEQRAFEVSNDDPRQKFYCLEMLPYPSGFLHMGHVRNYAIGDALAWYKRLQGFNVLHPIGWDSFGQPAEQAAIKRGVNPRVWTEENIALMRGQFKRLGISYDWSREIAAHRPDYYKWDQWFFLKMHERGLAYKKLSLVNWCPREGTVLSNEQSSGGVCWRCGAAVEKRDLEQWFLRITDYAEQLVAHLDQIENTWPEKVLKRQRDWVGRSEGAYIDFAVKAGDKKIRVFTTRIDTIFGATAIVLAAEHPLLAQLLEGSALKNDVLKFAQRVAAAKATRGVSTEEEIKEGLNTGLLAINPFSGESIPVWVANYVLMDYGTGAVMSVPAHDERDFEFAQKYSLPIRQVIAPVSHEQQPAEPPSHTGGDQSAEMHQAFVDYGILINSGVWSGKLSAVAMKEMAKYAEEKDFGGGAVTYRLRDWGISRQRFWGAPVPIINCEHCGPVPVPYDDLPVVLPETAEFTGTGESPLAGVAEFVNTTCPKCKHPARRETDTMDTFVDSSWYFFRYCDPRNESAPFDSGIVNQWTPVDQYIGGDSHAVMHLIYTRFWTKFMRDLGLVKFDEPVKKLLTQGMVTNRVEGTDEWKAMSKSLGNGVDPDEMIAAFGADATRVFVLFAAPPENELRWHEAGIEGALRFLRRVYSMTWRWRVEVENAGPIEPKDGEFMPYANTLRHETHRAIMRVTEDYDRLDFNTCVSSLMELTNAISTFETSFILADQFGARESREISQPGDQRIPAAKARQADVYAMREALEPLTLMLAPFTPHIAEEMWEGLGHDGGLIRGGAKWPKADQQLARKQELEIPVQVNGKVRGRIKVPPDISEERILQTAILHSGVAGWLEGCQIVKKIVVPQRLVNLVVKPGPKARHGFDKQSFREVCDKALKSLPTLVTDVHEDLETRREEALRHLYVELQAYVGSTDVPLAVIQGSVSEQLKLKIVLYCLNHAVTFFQAEPIVDEYVARAVSPNGGPSRN